MKLLIISGTPKTEGITHSFVEAAKDTAAQAGINAEVIRLADANLMNCKMCADGWGICFKEHRCAFGEEDGFAALHEKVKEADAYIYITPVYWGEISEGFKAFLDRLRRAEATKQWDNGEGEVSCLQGKPSIIVVNAGGGGGGIVTALADLERAIAQMSGDSWPRAANGIFDMIPVNRWNQDYKREAFKKAIVQMHKFFTGELNARTVGD